MADLQAKKKALFRAKLNAQKKEKRINSPLVRYNEFDQPVCRVCDLVLKSESLWDAHQASRKHHQAISNIKASAAGLSQAGNTKPEPSVEVSKNEHHVELKNPEPRPSKKLAETKPSSVLPPNFFDNPEVKKTKTGTDSVKLVDHDSSTNSVSSAKTLEVESGLPIGATRQVKNGQPARELTEKSEQIAALEAKQAKGALPEGFFDNKEADLRARGIKPVKIDVKDEYKEFEKLIQEDLREVDDRMEEEEIDAAETIQEYELLEQKAYREKVETLRKRRMELEVARSAKRSKSSKVADNKSIDEESSSDDDDDEENFAVDWRAQHL